MKYIYIFAFCILSHINATSQYLTPLQFDNYTPIWSHYALVPGLDDSQQGFWSIKEYLYYENDLILIQNVFDRQYLQGILVERIDHTTGEVKWQFSRYHSEIGTRECTRNGIIEGENLILPIYYEDNQSVTGFYSKCFLGSKTISLENGILIDSFESNQQDPLNRSLLVPFNPFVPLFGSYQFKLSDTTVSYVVQGGLENSTRFRQLTMNHEGHVIDSNLLEIPVPFQSFVVEVSRIDSNRSLIFCSGFRSDQATGQLDTYCKIGVTSLDLVPILNPKEISDELYPERAEYSLEWTSDQYFMIRVKEAKSSDPVLNDVYYVLLDYEGNIINRFKISGIEFVKNNAGIRAAFISTDQITLSGLEINGTTHNLNFYTNTTSENLEIVKSISSLSENQNLILFACSFTPDKNLLVHLNHKNNTLPLQIKPNWSLWMLFDSADLGVLTSSVDISSNKYFSLYPNPATNAIAIESEIEFNRFVIYDITGRVIKITHTNENQIDISQLPSGMYFGEIFKNNESVGKKKFVKTE